MRIAVFPGSFDPVTIGHQDIIARASKLFDRVYVSIVPNGTKTHPMFTDEQKLALMRASVEEFPNVEAELGGGLLTDYALRKNAQFLVRGVRNSVDFDAEQQLSLIYRDAVSYTHLTLPTSDLVCILNRDEALDLLDEIRAQLPVELSRAQELIRAKEDYVKAAKRDVERMMQQAEQDAKNKVSETEVLGIAREKSHEIIKKAEDRSREMYRVANEYTEDALRRTEEAIQMALEEVKQSRVRFRAASAEQMQKRREELAQSAEKQIQNG